MRKIAPLLGAIALVFASASGAVAQPTTTTTNSAATTPSVPVGLSLVSQSPWVTLGQTFTMTLHIDNPTLAATPGAAIALRVDQSVTSRSGFDDAIKNNDLGDTLSQPPTIPVASLTRDDKGDVTLLFGLARNSRVQPRLGISHPGVYPVEVQLVNTGVASRRFVTWLVAVADSSKPIDKPLSVAFVLQAVANPIGLPDGTLDPRIVAEMKPGGRLDQIATLLGKTAGFHLSLVVGPETAVAWKKQGAHNKSIAAAFQRVRASALSTSTELLPTTYVPIDIAALDAAGLGNYLSGQFASGAAALRSAFGANPASTAQSAFIDPAPTSDAAVNALRQMVIDRVAVRDEALIPVSHQFTPAQSFVLDTTGAGARGVSTAPFVEDLFDGPDPSALRAERVVAALAEIAYETPSIARGIVIAPPARWDPDLRTMETVIGALRTLPLVQSATLDELFAGISNEQVLGTDVQRRLVPAVPPATPVTADAYDSTVSKLAAFRAVVGPKDPVVVQGEAALRTNISTTISSARANTALTRINNEIDAFAAGVRADAKRITLTSRRADVPLTFENDLKPARNVTVRVHLDSAKLTFPKGADQTIVLKPGSNTRSFTVEARASGTFPMTIRITSPDGGLEFGSPVRVTVRSAVFGGWAVGVTIAALVFLAGWWANHFRRTRRNRRLAGTSPPPGAPAPPGTPAPAT